MTHKKERWSEAKRQKHQAFMAWVGLTVEDMNEDERWRLEPAALGRESR